VNVILTAVSTIEVRNPATGQPVGSVDCMTASQLVDVAGGARTAQRSWRKTSYPERARIIARFHDLALERSPKVLDTIQSETGKSRRDALAELVTVAGTARYYLAHGERFLAERRRRGAIPIVTQSVLAYRPHGLVGLITPWNYPFLLTVGDAIPALLAGNAVLIKPSEVTPLSASYGRSLLIESGLDPDLLIIVHGGPEIATDLIRLVDYIAFTGGTVTGRKVALAAAERLIPFSLELGGKNPMIVLRDAPLDQAAAALVAGAFANAGQTCIAIERVYVAAPVFDKFAALVTDNTGKIGWSQSFDMDMGSMIHAEHAAKVQSKIDSAIRAGARVLVGARRRSDLGNAFIEPTVLAQVDRQDTIAVEETFGPVVSLHRVEGRDEAIAQANDSRYGLNASVWAGGTSSAMSVAREIEAGSVAINSSLMIYNAFDLPMGGIKQSGIGRRHGERGILRYTQEQSIARSFQTSGGYDCLLTNIQSGQRADLLLKLTRWWRRIPGLR
jgi:succinate-semialdehyde dehydrogenase / glutarate-semialdehyde dehydrogenase